MASCYLVFVYGTLRQGRPNHYRLLEAASGFARYLGLATTCEKYPLVIASRYNIPYLLAAPGYGKCVLGEVYEVDDKMLELLDRLEDHPKYYERKMKKVKLQESGKELECWVYLLHKYKPFMMELPFLNDYIAAADDPEKQYIARYLRKEGDDYWLDVKMDEVTA
ncbi:putative gamma-glutamylcyclotransferase CG2811 isoform X1 [Portunus trituberculatus]|nr:putative gamma-glutamylcyclotransferase CG2811 isoform X1 [Portunus trituberculatus]XP_045108700.1 putative gamma-glutamylcyclotransferase CG2811 isoform X1 [Portunus trituberculatus]